MGQKFSELFYNTKLSLNLFDNFSNEKDNEKTYVKMQKKTR